MFRSDERQAGLLISPGLGATSAWAGGCLVSGAMAGWGLCPELQLGRVLPGARRGLARLPCAMPRAGGKWEWRAGEIALGRHPGCWLPCWVGLHGYWQPQLGSATELGLKRPGAGAIVAGCPFCRQSSGYIPRLNDCIIRAS